MDSVRKQSKLARRRMLSERFLGFLPWSLTIALAIALIGVLLPKVTYIAADNTVWYASWLASAAIIALIVNTSLTLIGRPTVADAAAEIDRRFGLRERLSSVLMLTQEDRETELGQALADDANVQAERIDVRDNFHWGFNRRLLLPLLPVLLSGIFWAVPNYVPEQVATTTSSVEANRIKQSTQKLMEQIKKRREASQKDGLEEAVDQFKKLEMQLEKLQSDTKLEKKDVLAKLNDIKEQLAERKNELGSAEELKKNLQNLAKFDSGPAQKLGDALKKGDFEQAEKAAEELLEKMKKGELSEAEQKQLGEQLEKMQQAMEQAAQQHEQAKEALKEQIRQAEAGGDMQKAAQLQRKLEEAEARDATMQQMQQMSEMLAKAQQAMEQGDMQEATEAMEQLAQQMQQMNDADSQLQDLDELLSSLDQSKSQMNCDKCSGAGCQKCMGNGMKMGMPGNGMGEGQGQGDRPEEETDTDFFDSQVRDRMKLGETVYGGKVGGANRKGNTTVEVQEAVLSTLAEEPEPLDDTPLPKNQRDHARDYFNAIREGN